MTNNKTSIPYTLETLTGAVNCYLKQWCEPILLIPNRYSSKKQPSISFEVSYNQTKHVKIKIKVLHGPFNEGKHVCKRTYLSISYINDDQIINQIFHALTFKGSPYHFYKTHFKKKLEVI